MFKPAAIEINKINTTRINPDCFFKCAFLKNSFNGETIKNSKIIFESDVPEDHPVIKVEITVQ